MIAAGKSARQRRALRFGPLFAITLTLAGASVPASAANLIADGGFEMQSQNNHLGGNSFFDKDACQLTGPLGGGCRVNEPWSGSRDAVFLLKGGTEVANGVNSPEGSFHALLAGDGQLFQSFVVPRSGDYVLSWLEGGEGRPTYPRAMDYIVAVFGSENGYQTNFAATQFQPFIRREMALPSLTGGGTYHLNFVGFGRCCNTGVLLLDDVRIESSAIAVPEPSAWALLILGFAAVGARMRKRRRGGRQVAGAYPAGVGSPDEFQ